MEARCYAAPSDAKFKTPATIHRRFGIKCGRQARVVCALRLRRAAVHWVSGGLLRGAHRMTMTMATAKATGSAEYRYRNASGAEQAQCAERRGARP